MEPQVWFRSLPPLSKLLFVLSLLAALFLRFHSGAFELMGLDWDRILQDGEVWRLFTTFLVFGASVPASLYQIGLLSVNTILTALGTGTLAQERFVAMRSHILAALI
jgi:hypothetical protein